MRDKGAKQFMKKLYSPKLYELVPLSSSVQNHHVNKLFFSYMLNFKYKGTAETGNLHRKIYFPPRVSFSILLS